MDVVEHPHTYAVKSHHCGWALPPPPPNALPADIIDYAQTLPAWERALFAGLQLLIPQDAFMISLATAQVLVAADGSVQEHRASFGWVMSDQQGNRIAQCNGPAYGARPGSYRAEGYGVLSVMRFFYHLKANWQVTNKFSVVCDNEAMVRRANEAKPVFNEHPNSTMDSEWDLLAEIWVTMRQLEDKTLSWIKGHQDDKQPYEKLSLPAQLNVDADKIADQYIQQNPDHAFHQVPLLPTSGIQLHLPVGTVTHKLKRELRLARTEPPLRAHLCERFGWSGETFEDTD